MKDQVVARLMAIIFFLEQNKIDLLMLGKLACYILGDSSVTHMTLLFLLVLSKWRCVPDKVFCIF